MESGVQVLAALILMSGIEAQEVANTTQQLWTARRGRSSEEQLPGHMEKSA